MRSRNAYRRSPLFNGSAPVAGRTLFSRYYFWYSFSLYRRFGA